MVLCGPDSNMYCTLQVYLIFFGFPTYMQWTNNLINPFTPKVDKFQISPAASPDIYITTGFMKN